MKFTYSTGQKPLEGYTIKRGIGKGGFGEVYFALSDGGKEVALKLIRGQTDVELRGIRQCLNLKHPNLVSLYDVKNDAHGEPWVVMEYVSGETLNSIMNRHPRGIPQELIRQWFPSLCRATGYLHDHGIVHRDLKPANIFLEAGLLKVGDYGLSKSMSSSHRSAQTQSVGTIHYMAPEISSGNYNKSIDIYALGVILYEMLSGAPPFDGESAQEIMMKHLMSLPDLTKVPAAFKPVLAKALAKDPNHRHQTAAELANDVEAIFGEVPVAMPVNVPAATAAPAPRPLLRPVGKAKEIPVSPRPPVPVVSPVTGEAIPVALPAFTLRDKVAELTGSLAMSAVFAAITTTLLAALRFTDNWNTIGTLFFMTVAVCWAVLIPSKFWSGKKGDEWMRRIVMIFAGALVGLLALWLDGWSPHRISWMMMSAPADSTARSTLGLSTGAAYISYFGLALGLLRWWKIADRRRDSWFSFFPVLATGIFALVLLFVYPDPEHPYGAAAVVIASMIVQWVSPWQAPPPPLPKRLRVRRA
jgi:hypothetical protein